jgi:hypothetical protein
VASRDGFYVLEHDTALPTVARRGMRRPDPSRWQAVSMRLRGRNRRVRFGQITNGNGVVFSRVRYCGLKAKRCNRSEFISASSATEITKRLPMFTNIVPVRRKNQTTFLRRGQFQNEQDGPHPAYWINGEPNGTDRISHRRNSGTDPPLTSSFLMHLKNISPRNHKRSLTLVLRVVRVFRAL